MSSPSSKREANGEGGGGRQLVIGIDGGATKTACVAMLISGHGGENLVVGKGGAGSSNKNSVGQDAAERAVAGAVEKALLEAGKGAGDVACIVLGMSGCDTEEDAAFWRGACTRIAPGARAVVENDAVVALCSGTGGELRGVIVIAGTGSIGMAIDGDRRVRAGGMGPLLGDAGNGHSIGCAALAAVARGADGRGPECGVLTREVLGLLGLKEVEDLLGWAYGPESAGGSSWDRVASLAPAVFAAAREEGEGGVSAGILRQAAQDICELAETAARRSGMADAPGGFALVLTGGINEAGGEGGLVGAAVDERVTRTMPRARVVRPSGVTPALAAAQLACRMVT